MLSIRWFFGIQLCTICLYHIYIYIYIYKVILRWFFHMIVVWWLFFFLLLGFLMFPCFFPIWVTSKNQSQHSQVSEEEMGSSKSMGESSWIPCRIVLFKDMFWVYPCISHYIPSWGTAMYFYCQLLTTSLPIPQTSPWRRAGSCQLSKGSDEKFSEGPSWSLVFRLFGCSNHWDFIIFYVHVFLPPRWDKMGVIPSGKRLHNYGKIHHFWWENPL